MRRPIGVCQKARVAWLLAVLPVVVLGCEGDHRPSPGASPYQLGLSPSDTVVHQQISEIEERVSLRPKVPPPTVDGDPLFQRIIDAELIGDTVFVVAAERQDSIMAFRASDGAWLGHVVGVPPGGRIDRIASVADGPQSLVFFDRRRSEAWVLQTGGQLLGPLRLRVGLGFGSISFNADTIWVETRELGDGPDDVTRDRVVQGFDLEGVERARYSLGVDSTNTPAFLVESSQGLQPSFVDRVWSTYSPSGVMVTALSGEYVLDIRTPTAASRVEVGFVPHVMDGEELGWWHQSARRVGSYAGIDYEISTTKPAFKDIRIDPFGRIWIWRHVEGVQRSELETPFPSRAPPVVEIPTFDVLQVSGDYLGTVRLPPRARILDIGETTLLVAERVTQAGNSDRLTLFSFDIRR